MSNKSSPFTGQLREAGYPFDLPTGSVAPRAISAHGGLNGYVLSLVQGIAKWVAIGAIATSSANIPALQRGDILYAESSSQLATLSSPGGGRVLFSDASFEPPAFRFVNASDVSPGSFPSGAFVFTGNVSSTTVFVAPSFGTVTATAVALNYNSSARLTLNSGNVTVGSNIDLIFATDNNASIGASGANRPENIFVASSVAIGGTPPGSTEALRIAGNSIIQTNTNSIGFTITGGSVTSGGANLIEIQQTWNTAGGPTLLWMNVTNTASGNSAFIDCLSSSASVFRVRADGVVVGTNTWSTNFIEATTALTTPLVGTNTNVDVVIERNNATIVTVGASSVTNDVEVLRVGSGAGDGRFRLRGFYTSNPSDPPQDQTDIILIDSGSNPVLRVRYNDAGSVKSFDVGPLV